MNNAGVNLRTGLDSAWTSFMTFIPQLILFTVILVAGYFLAKVAAKVLSKVLNKLGFDRLVERGGIKRTLERTHWTASQIVSTVLFYTVFLFVLQLAFSVFGPNPISNIITAVIAFLPSLFAALAIIIVAAAVATAAKQILQATLAGLSYGRFLANLVSAGIVTVGVFMALNQVGIAPAIVNGLFYAGLAIVVGTAVISLGCGGIAPMRKEWELMLSKMHQEAPKLKAAAANAPSVAQAKAEEKETIATATAEEHHDLPDRPRFPTQP
jgi:Mechanosensitive ion channel, conserved TM helix